MDTTPGEVQPQDNIARGDSVASSENMDKPAVKRTFPVPQQEQLQNTEDVEDKKKMKLSADGDTKETVNKSEECQASPTELQTRVGTDVQRQITETMPSSGPEDSSKISIGSDYSVSDGTLASMTIPQSDTHTDKLETQQMQYNSGLVKDNSSNPNGKIGIETMNVTEEEPNTKLLDRFECDFSVTPTEITACWSEFEATPGNYLKGCKWSPDGTCIMTNSEDKKLRIFKTPEELFKGKYTDLKEMESTVEMQEGELIYDYAWYPKMSSDSAASCCVVSSSRDTPVHMWDSNTGELRCSYRAYDHMDEIVAARSLAFSCDGTRLYCGFNKMIRVFNTSKPGRQFQNRPTYVKQGQPGIISCIAMNPQNHKMYAAGSYSRAVAIYSEPNGSMECMFEGQVGGVTHLVFSPDGNKLYSGGRKDPEVLCWDVRNPGTLLYTLHRQVLTNQRMYFCTDLSSRYLMSGNHTGTVSLWDTLSAPVIDSEGDPIIYPINTFKAHQDTCNGVSLHPTLPVIATASGLRKFTLSEDQSESEEEVEADITDNSLRLWWIGKT